MANTTGISPFIRIKLQTSSGFFLKSYFDDFGTFSSLDLCWLLMSIYDTAIEMTERWI